MTQRVVKVLGSVTTLLGIILVVWPAVEMYFLFSGRLQPDMEQLSVGAAAVLIVLGLVLSVLGYRLQK